MIDFEYMIPIQNREEEEGVFKPPPIMMPIKTQ